MTIPSAIACAALGLVAAGRSQRQVRLQREAFIRSFGLRKGLFEQPRKRHPALGLKECQVGACRRR